MFLSTLFNGVIIYLESLDQAYLIFQREINTAHSLGSCFRIWTTAFVIRRVLNVSG
jgi:hypothetical protein